MTLVRLEPTALRSRVKHSTTEPLRSHDDDDEDNDDDDDDEDDADGAFCRRWNGLIAGSLS